jgi:hypothetical protein
VPIEIWEWMQKLLLEVQVSAIVPQVVRFLLLDLNSVYLNTILLHLKGASVLALRMFVSFAISLSSFLRLFKDTPVFSLPSAVRLRNLLQVLLLFFRSISAYFRAMRCCIRH